MRKDLAVRFIDVSKEYKLYKNSKHKFLAAFFKKVPHKKKVANSNMSFQIKKGESVAVLGRNGAGKSTLLKLITGVTAPTCGEIELNGKVSALLELTAGFEPDFTGRENIYLRGLLRGVDSRQIAQLEGEIITFADLDEYIDQPVRTYSSGMKARLGFAICVNIDPEILLVDEALSVGDEQFKNKCLKKIREIISKEDVTLILVTHSAPVAREFCSRGIVLDKGKIAFDGQIGKAVEQYQKLVK